jgi:hypothetical protein
MWVLTASFEASVAQFDAVVVESLFLVKRCKNELLLVSHQIWFLGSIGGTLA